VHPGLLTKDGNPVGVQAIVRDISERKNTEKRIQESYERFEGLFRHNPEAAIYLDLNFKIVDANPRFSVLFGYSAEEVKGKNINDLIVPKGMCEEAENLDKDAKNGYASHDTVRKRKDGSLVYVSISAAPVAFENNLLGYVGIYKDITDLKRAQEESEESRRHFQTLFNLMADPVAIVDDRGNVLDVTQKVEEVFGFKKEEVVGRNFAEKGILTAKTKEIMAKKLAERISGELVAPYEVELLTKDGRKLPVEINASAIQYKGKPATLNVIRDVSERKKMEEKLRIVGSLTRHDVRNKLTAIMGNIYISKKKLADRPDVLESFNDMESVCDQIVRIFEFARDYERLGVEKLTFVDLGKVVDKVAGSFLDLKGTRVVNDCHGIAVLADSLLERLFYNLIDNSLKYGEKLNQIRVSHEESEDGLRLFYEDDGIGISEDTRPKIFNEGFTTGKGSGYGLYLIRRMMEVYGWAITETGTYGKGAQFTISIPKARPDGRQNYKLD
jgi:PAS domain S-box-containing protein